MMIVWRLIFQGLILVSLILFGFGDQDENVKELILDGGGGRILGNPFLLALRFYFPAFIVAILFIYGINHKVLTSSSGLVLLLCALHIALAVKYVSYANWAAALKSVGNAITLYLLASLCLTSVSILSKENIKRIALYGVSTNLAIAYSAYVFIGGTYITSIGYRYCLQYANPNHAGVGLVAMLGLFLVFHSSTDWRERMKEIILIIGTAHLVFITGSRTAQTGLFLLLLLRYTRKANVGNFSWVIFASFLLIFVGIYVGDTGESWQGRADRRDTWLPAFTAPEYDFAFGANFVLQRPYIEGFWVTLPYTFGVLGAVAGVLMIYLFTSRMYRARKAYKAVSSAYNVFCLLAALGWMCLFESILFGTLMQPTLVFLLVLGWLNAIRKYCNHSPEFCSYRY